MPEAPPERPGHAGVPTPQPVGSMLVRSRLAGALHGTAMTTPSRSGPFASQSFRQPQAFRRRSLFTVLASIDRMARIKRELDYRQPWPDEFRAGTQVANE